MKVEEVFLVRDYAGHVYVLLVSWPFLQIKEKHE